MLKCAAKNYNFDRETLQFVAQGRESSKRIYAFTKHGKEYILRVVNGRHIGQTRAEMDWLAYLAGKGVSVSAPLEAVDGALTVPAREKGVACVLSAFSRAQGQSWDKNDPNLWNETIFYHWGKVVGDMHRVTKDYKPPEGQEKRPEYSGFIRDTVKAFPSVNRAAEELAGAISRLPKDRDSYGLVHYDMNPYNFLIDGESINVFDFDGCTYAWFALDIASALYTSLWFGRRNDAGRDFTGGIIEYFLKGYLSTNTLDDFWLSKVPMFMRLCQIAKFSHIYHGEDPHDEHQKERLRNIENGVLFTGCAIDHPLFGLPY